MARWRQAVELTYYTRSPEAPDSEALQMQTTWRDIFLLASDDIFVEAGETYTADSVVRKLQHLPRDSYGLKPNEIVKLRIQLVL